MTIKKHSYLDIPKWCKVVHFEGEQMDNVLKYVLLSLKVKTWDHDINLSHFVQDINLDDEYTSINKYRKIARIDATKLTPKQHTKMLTIVSKADELGLLPVIRTDSSKETRKCFRRNHVGISCSTTQDKNTYNIRLQYTHNKYGSIDKSYHLTISDGGEMELIFQQPTEKN